jgi:ubiquinone biosynthesis protein COQ4
MNAAISNPALFSQSFKRPRRHHRPQVRRALRALRDLLDHPDHTEKAFEVGYALDGDIFEANFAKMLALPAGRRVFSEKPCLLDLLEDRDALLAMPEGSVGRAYLDHIDRYGLEPAKLVQLRRETDENHAARDEHLRWFVERSDLIHDLWHVLSGYGADGHGEGALLAFSLAQRYTRSGVLLTFGASSRIVQGVGTPWLRYVWRAWRRGRKAVHLTALPYEELLPLPLAEVRRAAGIDDPRTAHPGGILCDRPDDSVASA